MAPSYADPLPPSGFGDSQVRCTHAAGVSGGEYWMMSLQRVAYDSFKAVLKDLQETPQFRPTPRIQRFDEDGVVEQEIRIVAPFDWETVGRPRRRKIRPKN